MLPALRHHALRREVDDIWRFLARDEIANRIEIAVEIELEEAELLVTAGPAVGKKRSVRLGRAADADHERTLVQEMIDEARPGKRVRAEHQEGFVGAHAESLRCGGLRHSHCMAMCPTINCRSSEICMSSNAK